MARDIDLVESDGTPAVVMNTMNKVMGLFIRTGISKRMDDRLWMLRTKGRRTGRTIATPVGLHLLEDGRRVMSAGGAWRHNFHDPHPLELRRGGESVSGTGQLLADRDEAAAIYHEIAVREAAARGIKGVNRLLGVTITSDEVTGLDQWRDVAEARGVVDVT